jgi:hypothetical protein
MSISNKVIKCFRQEEGIQMNNWATFSKSNRKNSLHTSRTDPFLTWTPKTGELIKSISTKLPKWSRIKHLTDFSHKCLQNWHHKWLLKKWWIPKWWQTPKCFFFTNRDRPCWSGSFKSSWSCNNSRYSSFPVPLFGHLNSNNSLNNSLIIWSNITTITTSTTRNGSKSKMNIIKRERNHQIKGSIKRNTMSIPREKTITRSQDRSNKEILTKKCLSSTTPNRMSPNSRKPPKGCNKSRIIWILN